MILKEILVSELSNQLIMQKAGEETTIFFLEKALYTIYANLALISMMLKGTLVSDLSNQLIT